MTLNREKRLDGKVALVMGGTGGIGRAVAIEFALCGASVSVVGRRIKEGSDVVAEIVNQGGNASLFVEICPINMRFDWSLRMSWTLTGELIVHLIMRGLKDH